jgi:hypothetical protein
MKLCSICGNERNKPKKNGHGRTYFICQKCSVTSECRRVRARRMGEGPSGLVGRFRVLLPRLRSLAKSKGYSSPTITPDEMLKIWESQKGFCVACGGVLSLQGSNGSCFDHNHETGEPRGFIHRDCNSIEGLFSKMSDEAVMNYLTWMKEVVQQKPITFPGSSRDVASLAG